MVTQPTIRKARARIVWAPCAMDVSIGSTCDDDVLVQVCTFKSSA